MRTGARGGWVLPDAMTNEFAITPHLVSSLRFWPVLNRLDPPAKQWQSAGPWLTLAAQCRVSQRLL